MKLMSSEMSLKVVSVTFEGKLYFNINNNWYKTCECGLRQGRENNLIDLLCIIFVLHLIDERRLGNE